mgnify:CR=1 FL=1
MIDEEVGGVSLVPAPLRDDRAAGAVLASAAGDALGAGYEFGPPLDHEAPVAMIGGGAFGWAPGEWTDDTQMATAILLPLAACDDDPLPAVEAGFRTWFASDPPDVGNQTRHVLSSGGSLAAAAAAFCVERPHAAGNGSLMRTGPIALAHPGDPGAIAALARAVSSLTHAHDDCVDACVLWSVAIDHAIHHAPPSGRAYDWLAGIRAGLDHLPPERRERWTALVEEAYASDPRRFERNGWVVHAFQAALATISSTRPDVGGDRSTHLERALETAVRCGGDTDTVAAIAGSLLGARWGAAAVPHRWRRLLHGRTPDGSILDAVALDHLARLAYRHTFA